MSEEAFVSLLDAIEIDSIFIKSELADLLETVNQTDVRAYPVLISMAVDRWERKLDLKEASPDQITAGHRGQSLNDEKILMPEVWQLDSKLGKRLVELFKLDPDFITKKSLEFKKRVLSGPVYKRELSRNWQRSFVDHLMGLIPIAVRSHQQMSESKPVSEKQAATNRKIIEEIIRKIVASFSIDRVRPKFKNWNPSQGVAIALLKEGISREATYHQMYLGPFRNLCEKEKVPYAQADQKYKRYMLEKRESLLQVANGS